MNCFMFPGQPLTRPDSLPDDPDFAEIAQLVRRITGLDLASFRWTEGEGSENVKLQVLGVAQSLHALRALRGSGMRPALVTQHSMGIYAALAACGSVSEAQALEIAWRVGLSMSGMAQEGPYALCCVIGLTADPVLAVARNNRVHLANHNTSRHFLLCGRKGDIDAAASEALEKGAFSIRSFDCDAPLHTPLMAPLERELRGIFAGYRYGEPACPLMDHLEQRLLSGSDIGDFLLRELCLPVYWERTYRAARSAGVTSFIEVGSGDSLKKYNRWIEGEIETSNR